MREVGPDGWTCMVCGDYRPDVSISVWTRTKMLTPWLPVTQNVRFCNDRPECAVAAKRIVFP